MDHFRFSFFVEGPNSDYPTSMDQKTPGEPFWQMVYLHNVFSWLDVSKILTYILP